MKRKGGRERVEREDRQAAFIYLHEEREGERVGQADK